MSILCGLMISQPDIGECCNDIKINSLNYWGETYIWFWIDK